MKLCCQVNPRFVCLHCKEIMCIDCGKPYGLAHHFILHQCRKRFTLEQQKKWQGGAPKTSAPWRRFRQCKLDRATYIGGKDVQWKLRGGRIVTLGPHKKTI